MMDPDDWPADPGVFSVTFTVLVAPLGITTIDGLMVPKPM